MTLNKNELKRSAAEKAVEYVKSGMTLGLGTGSTLYFALSKIAGLLRSGVLKDIKGVPTSKQTENQALKLGIPLTTFKKRQEVDLTIDGADEVDENLNLIKGGGGALLREKIVAQASKKTIIAVDESKISKKLGEKWHVPIEVVKFAVDVESKFLESLGAEVFLRKEDDGSPFITDENNYILDANFGIIKKTLELAERLEKRAGIVEHGLFINLTDIVLVASGKGVKTFKNS